MKFITVAKGNWFYEFQIRSRVLYIRHSGKGKRFILDRDPYWRF